MVEAHNIDEVFSRSRAKYNNVLCRAARLERNTTSSVFILLSPQFMCEHRDFTKMLIDQAKNRVLRLVVVDKVHLHVQQGTSFRGELRLLNDIFLWEVFGNTPLHLTPKAVFATG